MAEPGNSVLTRPSSQLSIRRVSAADQILSNIVSSANLTTGPFEIIPERRRLQPARPKSVNLTSRVHSRDHSRCQSAIRMTPVIGTPAPMVSQSALLDTSDTQSTHTTGNLMLHHKRGRSWGIDGYLAPNNDWSLVKTKTFWAKSKKENFMETQARRRKDLPAPTAYKIKCEWSGTYSDGGGHTGRWLKAPKLTLIDDILKQKKLKLPGPGQYKVNDFKIPNMPKQNTEKGDFINNCRWYGMQTPGWKYKLNYDAIRPKTPAAKYYVKKAEEGKTGKSASVSLPGGKQKKTKDPAPGSYEVEECIRKTQWPKNIFAF